MKKTLIAVLLLMLAFSVYKTYSTRVPAENADSRPERSTPAVVSEAELKELMATSAKGERIAQYRLGLFYARGADNLKQDYQKAHELLLKAAMQGVPMAMYHLGEMYVMGDGVKENFEEATVWFWLATSLGDTYAQKRLRAINTRISPQALADAKVRVEKLWKEIPHDLKIEKKSLH